MRRCTADRPRLCFRTSARRGPFPSCAPAHIRQKPEEQSTIDRKGSRSQRGHGYDQVLSLRGRRRGLFLEHRFPFAATLISVFIAGNVGSAILMLLAQAEPSVLNLLLFPRLREPRAD